VAVRDRFELEDCLTYQIPKAYDNSVIDSKRQHHSSSLTLSTIDKFIQKIYLEHALPTKRICAANLLSSVQF